MTWDAARKKRWPPKTPEQRVTEFLRDKCVPTPDGCIVCMLQAKDKRLGSHVQAFFGGKRWIAHRYVYTVLKGPIPSGFDVCHSCDNPKCMNIMHLWLGTRAENNRDCQSKGRHGYDPSRKTHCPRGHEYSPENTYYTPKGHRDCRQCTRERSRVDYVKPERPPMTKDQLRQQRYRLRKKQRLQQQHEIR